MRERLRKCWRWLWEGRDTLFLTMCASMFGGLLGARFGGEVGLSAPLGFLAGAIYGFFGFFAVIS